MAKTPVKVNLVTKPLSLPQTFAAVRKNVLSILPEVATRQPIVSGRTGAAWHMLMDPKGLRRVLLENLDNYPKSNVTKNMLRPAIGNSIFIVEGEEWRWQRRAAAPVFTPRNMKNLSPIMIEAANRCVERLTEALQHPIDLNDEMVRTTFEIIADVTFSDENGFDRQAVHKALNDYMDSSARVSVLDFFNLPDWVPRPNRIISRSAMQNIHTLAEEVITAREGAGASTPPDLLDLLFDGEDPETKRKMDPIVIRDNLLAFITAGHETTALTLSWALYLLAFDPEVQDKARQEVRDVIGDGLLSIEHVERLTYVRQVIDETLRLYPPAPIVSRTAQKDDVLCGRKIRAGQTVLIPIYCLHRHQMLWEDPDAFRPERFGADQKHDRFSYLPFIDGPRVCIGASFALQEAVIILATLLQKFEFDAIPSKQPVPEMILTMRPTGGVWLKVRPAS